MRPGGPNASPVLPRFRPVRASAQLKPSGVSGDAPPSRFAAARGRSGNAACQGIPLFADPVVWSAGMTRNPRRAAAWHTESLALLRTARFAETQLALLSPRPPQ